jgi:hypothetical protein
MSAGSASSLVKTPRLGSPDKVASEVDAKIVELGRGRDVLTAMTTTLADSTGGTRWILVTVVWREP